MEQQDPRGQSYPTMDIDDIQVISVMVRGLREMADLLVGFAENNNMVGVANGLAELHSLSCPNKANVGTFMMFGCGEGLAGALRQIELHDKLASIPEDSSVNPYRAVRERTIERLCEASEEFVIAMAAVEAKQAVNRDA